MFDLPGHADEVYGVDWSPDGMKVCSGGKDKLLKIWKNWEWESVLKCNNIDVYLCTYIMKINKYFPNND